MKDSFPIVGMLMILLTGARSPGHRRATEDATTIPGTEHPVTVGTFGVGNVLEGTLILGILPDHTKVFIQYKDGNTRRPVQKTAEQVNAHGKRCL